MSEDESLMPHAHTFCVEPETRLLYFPLQDIDGHPILRIIEPAVTKVTPYSKTSWSVLFGVVMVIPLTTDAFLLSAHPMDLSLSRFHKQSDSLQCTNGLPQVKLFIPQGGNRV